MQNNNEFPRELDAFMKEARETGKPLINVITDSWYKEVKQKIERESKNFDNAGALENVSYETQRKCLDTNIEFFDRHEADENVTIKDVTYFDEHGEELAEEFVESFLADPIEAAKIYFGYFENNDTPSEEDILEEFCDFTEDDEEYDEALENLDDTLITYSNLNESLVRMFKYAYIENKYATATSDEEKISLLAQLSKEALVKEATYALELQEITIEMLRKAIEVHKSNL